MGSRQASRQRGKETDKPAGWEACSEVCREAGGKPEAAREANRQGGREGGRETERQGCRKAGGFMEAGSNFHKVSQVMLHEFVSNPFCNERTNTVSLLHVLNPFLPLPRQEVLFPQCQSLRYP